MKIKNCTYYLLPALLGWMMTTDALADKADKAVTVVPKHSTALTPDSTRSVWIDVDFHIPEGVFSRRSRLIIVPQLLEGDSLRDEYLPLVADAPIYSKKRYRRMKLEGYVDPYADVAQAVGRPQDGLVLPYRRQVQLPEGVAAGHIVAVVTTDGCGECTSIDTLQLGAISNLAPLIGGEFRLNWMERPFVVRPKVMNGTGEAHLQFKVNRYDIDLSLGNNRAEMDQMLETLRPLVNDPLTTLNRFEIYGMASADGSLAYNTTLSANRANAAKQWLAAQLRLSADVQRRFKVGSRPEGWEPVLEAMRRDGHPDTLKVQEILEKYADQNDDVQERYIRRLACWNDIKDKYLQKDRKVEYAYSYTVKSFTTDRELLEVYATRPDAFNEDELLRVAMLQTTDANREQVYRTALKQFPQSELAACNLAAILLRSGRAGEAARLLAGVESTAPEVVNARAAALAQTGQTAEAIRLLEPLAASLEEARYNLGLLYAAQNRAKEAYTCLHPFADVNSAIAALAIGADTEAETVLDGCAADVSPRAEYARALVAARKGEAAAVATHLKAACADEALCRRAAGEPDFDRYRTDDAFRTTVNRNR